MVDVRREQEQQDQTRQDQTRQDLAQQDLDDRFMAAALALGRRGLGRTAPNPAVGALVVRDGVILGRGWTAPGGRPHAETIALAEAGPAARGATIYVTLEPCRHHGRTGPCCEAIVAAGIARLVFAVEDPNPIAGRGADFCRDHGVSVTGGVRQAEAARDHRGHILSVTRHRPAVTLKLAQTANGYAAGGPYDPRLSITGLAANGAVHVLRAMHDAVMVGIGTVLADDPLLTVRLPGLDARPLRVVIDPLAQTPPQARLIRSLDDAPVLVFIGTGAPAERVAPLLDIAGLELVPLAMISDDRLDLAAILAALGQRGITRVFSEGGPTVAGTLIEEGLADEVLIFTAPRPLASEGVPALSATARAILDDAARYRLTATQEIGVDRLRRYESVGACLPDS